MAARQSPQRRRLAPLPVEVIDNPRSRRERAARLRQAGASPSSPSPSSPWSSSTRSSPTATGSVDRDLVLVDRTVTIFVNAGDRGRLDDVGCAIPIDVVRGGRRLLDDVDHAIPIDVDHGGRRLLDDVGHAVPVDVDHGGGGLRHDVDHTITVDIDQPGFDQDLAFAFAFALDFPFASALDVALNLICTSSFVHQRSQVWPRTSCNLGTVATLTYDLGVRLRPVTAAANRAPRCR